MLMVIQLGVVRSEHMDLRGGNTGTLQLLFNDFQVIQVVAYEIAPQRFHIVPPCFITLPTIPRFWSSSHCERTGR
ncbi:MAG: hypothetical protein AUH79_00490 [Betaproteobacteria bacterium 13_1_40CM_4_64_4]|nr:MAG: hypothetical protein AUH79_00490 [Betaproteobacteria bacterium 13_1_40CM_4_64_4]